MTTSAGEDYVNYRRSRSREVFNDACLLADNGRWNSCVNRLYYSSFYMVSALLYKNNIRPETHNGTRTQFNKHFVRSGMVPVRLAKLYSNLFTWRQESDYADFLDFEGETVLRLISEVSEFNETINQLINQKDNI